MARQKNNSKWQNINTTFFSKDCFKNRVTVLEMCSYFAEKVQCAFLHSEFLTFTFLGRHMTSNLLNFLQTCPTQGQNLLSWGFKNIQSVCLSLRKGMQTYNYKVRFGNDYPCKIRKEITGSYCRLNDSGLFSWNFFR